MFVPGLVVEVKSRCVRIIPAASAPLSAASVSSFSAAQWMFGNIFTLTRYCSLGPICSCRQEVP
jgi:hypothetical protein